MFTNTRTHTHTPMCVRVCEKVSYGSALISFDETINVLTFQINICLLQYALDNKQKSAIFIKTETERREPD